MTASVFAVWPDHPPYSGAHAEMVPHLTVGHVSETQADRIAAKLGSQLPMRSDVREVWLMTSHAGRWTRHAAFALGSQAFAS